MSFLPAYSVRKSTLIQKLYPQRPKAFPQDGQAQKKKDLGTDVSIESNGYNTYLEMSTLSFRDVRAQYLEVFMYIQSQTLAGNGTRAAQKFFCYKICSNCIFCL